MATSAKKMKDNWTRTEQALINKYIEHTLVTKQYDRLFKQIYIAIE